MVRFAARVLVVDAPTGMLLGASLGVSVPLLGMRLFAPEQSFKGVRRLVQQEDYALRFYQHALQFFTAAEISEAFAAARGLALPSQLRRAIRASGRELHEEFLQLLPRRPAPSGFSAGARAGWAPWRSSS